MDNYAKNGFEKNTFSDNFVIDINDKSRALKNTIKLNLVECVLNETGMSQNTYVI